MKRENPAHIQKWFIQIIIFSITAALVWWTLRQVSFADLWRTLASIHPAWLALLVVVNTIVIWLFSRRWHLLLQVLNYTPPYRHLMAYRLVAFGISYFTPGTQFGGEPAQVMLLSRRDGIPMRDAILSVTVDKMFELTFNFAFLGIGIFTILQTGRFPQEPLSGVLMAALLLAGLPIAVAIIFCRGENSATRWLGCQLQRHSRWEKTLSPIIDTLANGVSLCRTASRQMLIAGLLSIVVWAALIAEYWLMTRAIGLQLSLMQTIILLTAARLAFLFPTPGALGTLESGQVIAMQMLGFDAALGLSLSLLIRSRDVLFGVAGLWIGKILSNS